MILQMSVRIIDVDGRQGMCLASKEVKVLGTPHHWEPIVQAQIADLKELVEIAAGKLCSLREWPQDGRGVISLWLRRTE